MDYKEFVSTIEKEVGRRFPENQVLLQNVMKNNSIEKIGIAIRREDCNISSIIYLEQFYDKYLKGTEVSKITEEIALVYNSLQKGTPDYGHISNFEDIKDKIAFKLINTERNKKFLESVPFIPYLDLAIIFYAVLNISEEETAGMTLTNEIIKKWKVNEKELWPIAVENSAKILPAELFTMKMHFDEIALGKDIKNLLIDHSGERDAMYVLSNKIRTYGAACIAYPGIAEKIGDILCEDYFIIPSSTEEVIIIPKSSGASAAELNDMIKEVNRNHVVQDEILSEHCYQYIYKDKKIII